MKLGTRLIHASMICCSVIILATSCAKKDGSPQTFFYASEHPLPGETITVTYVPNEKFFRSARNIRMLAYLYTAGYPKVIPVDMVRQDGKWTGSFESDPDSFGAAVKFKSGDYADNNQKSGFFILFFDKNGIPVPGAMAGQAEAHASWGERLLGIERNPSKALQLFDGEFRAHPEMKRIFLYTYIRTLILSKPEGWEETATAAADAVAAETDLDEDTMNALVNCYRQLKKQDKMEAIAARARAEFPYGYQAQIVSFQEFNKEEDLNKKVALLEKFKSDFPESNMINTMAHYIARGYLSSGKIEDLKIYMKDNPDIKERYPYNMAAIHLIDMGIELDFAAELLQKAIRLTERELENPENKPGFLTREEWEDQIHKYSLSGMLATHGNLLAKQGNLDAALKSLEKAVVMSGRSQPELNERFGEILIAQKHYQKAFDELFGFIKEGKSTARMKDMLKTAYAEVTGGEEGFAAYYDQLDSAATDRLREELQKEMVNEPAPEFRLEDLDGNQVSLASLKGKTVILDFWATWCGPCIGSFPGMKRAVEKHKDDPTVTFLFVNTWEREEDREKNARDYITENEYPFRVLLDTEDKVVEAFQVRGIPTKFVIDKNGNIRFTKIGYDGNDETMIKELDLMIALVK